MKQTIRKTCYILLMSMGIAGASWADQTSTQVPTDLMYQGNPIDALCFNTQGATSPIPLNNCGIKKEKYTSKGQNADMVKKGYIGFDWKDTTVSYPAEGYSYYKFFPADNQQFWVYTINNTGGSGEFTAINLVKRNPSDALDIKTIVGGDRCNGGVQDVQAQGNGLQFSVNLTAFDMLALAKEGAFQLKAYDDLAACAVCCVGKAFYQVNADLKPKLLFVNLNPAANISELPTQGKYQQCFNELFKKYIDAGKSKLNDSQLQQFSKDFNEKCLSQAAR